MIPERLKSWVDSGESEILELKSTTGERKEAAISMCAMLNQRGGRILFGVRKDGRIIGQEVSDNTIHRVCQELNLIDPPAMPSIDRE